MFSDKRPFSLRLAYTENSLCSPVYGDKFVPWDLLSYVSTVELLQWERENVYYILLRK